MEVGFPSSGNGWVVVGLLEMVNANLKFQRTIHLVFALGESTKLSGSGVFTCANGVLSLNGL